MSARVWPGERGRRRRIEAVFSACATSDRHIVGLVQDQWRCGWRRSDSDRRQAPHCPSAMWEVIANCASCLPQMQPTLPNIRAGSADDSLSCRSPANRHSRLSAPCDAAFSRHQRILQTCGAGPAALSCPSEGTGPLAAPLVDHGPGGIGRSRSGRANYLQRYRARALPALDRQHQVVDEPRCFQGEHESYVCERLNGL
jgi:hypothetical protein